MNAHNGPQKPNLCGTSTQGTLSVGEMENLMVIVSERLFFERYVRAISRNGDGVKSERRLS